MVGEKIKAAKTKVKKVAKNVKAGPVAKTQVVKERVATKSREAREGVKKVSQGPLTKVQIGHYAKKKRGDVYGQGDQYLRQVGKVKQLQKAIDLTVSQHVEPYDVLPEDEQKALNEISSFYKKYRLNALQAKRQMNRINSLSLAGSEAFPEVFKRIGEKTSPDIQRLRIDRLRSRHYRPFIGDVRDRINAIFNDEEKKLEKAFADQAANLSKLNMEAQATEDLKTMLINERKEQQTQLEALREAYLETANRSNLRAKYRTDWVLPQGAPQSIALSDSNIADVVPDKAMAIRKHSRLRFGIHTDSVMCKRVGQGIEVKKVHSSFFGKDYNRDDIRFMLQFAMKCGKTTITVDGFDEKTRHRIYQEALKAGLNVNMPAEDELKPKNKKLFATYSKVRQRYKDKTVMPDQQGTVVENPGLAAPQDQEQQVDQAQPSTARLMGPPNIRPATPGLTSAPGDDGT